MFFSHRDFFRSGLVLAVDFRKLGSDPPQKEPKSRNPGEPADDVSAGGRRKRLGFPGFLDFGLPGGCASSRLDHGLKV